MHASSNRDFLHDINSLIIHFQNVCFFAVSDDIKNATQLLQNEVNKKYKVSFPGDGEVSDPGIDS